MTVAENIAVVPKLLKWPAARIRGRVDELLEMVHLPPDEYRTRMPANSPVVSSSGRLRSALAPTANHAVGRAVWRPGPADAG